MPCVCGTMVSPLWGRRPSILAAAPAPGAVYTCRLDATAPLGGDWGVPSGADPDAPARLYTVLDPAAECGACQAGGDAARRMLHRALVHIRVTGPGSRWLRERGESVGVTYILPTMSTARVALGDYVVSRRGAEWEAPLDAEVLLQSGVRRAAQPALPGARNVFSTFEVSGHRTDIYADMSTARTDAAVIRGVRGCTHLTPYPSPPVAPFRLRRAALCAEKVFYSNHWGQQLSEVVLMRAAIGRDVNGVPWGGGARCVLSVSSHDLPAWSRWAIDAVGKAEAAHGVERCWTCRSDISDWLFRWVLSEA